MNGIFIREMTVSRILRLVGVIKKSHDLTVEVYEDEYGNPVHINVRPALEHIEHETKILAAKERQVRQQISLELAYAELEDIQQIVQQRSPLIEHQPIKQRLVLGPRTSKS